MRSEKYFKKPLNNTRAQLIMRQDVKMSITYIKMGVKPCRERTNEDRIKISLAKIGNKVGNGIVKIFKEKPPKRENLIWTGVGISLSFISEIAEIFINKDLCPTEADL